MMRGLARFHLRRGYALAGLFLASLACCVLPTTRIVRAEDPPAAPSLKLVPQDVAFYSALLRNREQVEIVAKSKFWKQLNDMEFVKHLRTSLKDQVAQPEHEWHSFFEKLELPENQQALDVVLEMLSDEIFAYGGPDVADLVVASNDATNAVRFEQVMQELTHVPQADRPTGLLRAALNSLTENVDRLKVPEFVLAMRVKNKEAAEEQLRRIEAYARVLPEHVPELAKLRGKFKTVRIGTAQFLTLPVDGSVIPWDKVPFDDAADKPGQFDKLRDKLKSMKLVIALGLHEDYVVLSIGKSTDHLAAWAKGDVLANLPKLKVLRDKGPQRYTSVSYISPRMAQANGVQARNLDRLVKQVELQLPKSKLSEDDQKQILADAKLLATELKDTLPTPDAKVAFSFLTPKGIETYQYDWSQIRLLDGSKPLPVLQHVGTQPLLAFALRHQVRPQDYDLLVTMLGKGRKYFEKYGLPEMEEKDQENYKTIGDIVFPILARADKVNREMLLPALADGQTALVVDGTLKSKQWSKQIPATTEETALPMPALVLGVSDRTLLEKALGEYRLMANEMVTKLRPLVPKAPEFELPAPETRTADGATVYYFPVAGKMELDKQLAPNGGLTDKYFVVSFSPRLTSSLLKQQKLAAAAEGPLSGSADRPLVGAGVFDFPQMVDLTVPWINEGVRQYVHQLERMLEADLEAPDELEAAEEETPRFDSPSTMVMLAQVKQVGELLKVFRGVTSAAYKEDGAMVGHSEIRFRDLP